MRRLKKHEVRIGLIIIIFSIVYFVIFNFYINVNSVIWEAAFPICLFISGVIYLMVKYLKVNQVKNISTLDSTEPILVELRLFLNKTKETQEKFRSETVEIISDLKAQIDSFSELNINKDQKDRIIEAFKNSISTNLNNDFYSDLNVRLTNRLAEEKLQRYNSLIKDFEDTKNRLKLEASEIEAKGTLNLILGAFLALLGLGYLYYLQIDKPIISSNLLFAYNKVFSRYSVVILIEILAFFFLRLYKSSYAESKYFQNELTTVELKFASLFTAINFGCEKDISNVTIELSKGERNIILKKGESTTELQMQKNDTSEINSVIKILNSIKEKK